MILEFSADTPVISSTERVSVRFKSERKDFVLLEAAGPHSAVGRAPDS